MKKLFVYGTLKKGYALNHVLSKSKKVGNYITKQKGFEMTGFWFPYVWENENSEFRIKGELYEVNQDDFRTANNDIILDTFLSEGSLKSQLRRANKNNCSYAIIIGEDEVKNNQVIWKDLTKGGEQELLSLKEVIEKYTNL